ncbi:MAG: transcription termination/antitermination NusG family protein [Clostridia bacterium]
MDSWYALQVATGREGDVVAMLHRCGIQAIAPAVGRLERKGGEWQMVSRRAIPGYVFVRCQMNAPLYYHLMGKPYVLRLLGQVGERYTAIPDDQVGWIDALHRATGGRTETSRGVRREDDTVEIVSGPLKELEEKIVKVDARGRRATVELTLYDDAYQIDMALDMTDKSDK